MTEVFVDEVHIPNMACIGKKHGFNCTNCLMKSWCDGIPIKE